MATPDYSRLPEALHFEDGDSWLLHGYAGLLATGIAMREAFARQAIDVRTFALSLNDAQRTELLRTIAEPMTTWDAETARGGRVDELAQRLSELVGALPAVLEAVCGIWDAALALTEDAAGERQERLVMAADIAVHTRTVCKALGLEALTQERMERIFSPPVSETVDPGEGTGPADARDERLSEG